MKVLIKAIMLSLPALACAAGPLVADVQRADSLLLGRPARLEPTRPVQFTPDSDTILIRRWAAPPLRVAVADLRREVIRETNRARRRVGAEPLEPDAALARAGQHYARELARRREIQHFSATPGRETFRDRVEAEGIDPRIAGENLARLTAAPARLARRVVDAWLDSPGHRRNLLDDIFTRTGVGVMLGGDGVWYVVQYYATPE